MFVLETVLTDSIAQLSYLIADTETAVSQVLQMVKEQTVTATNGETISLKGETICIHGDGEDAVEFAKHISKEIRNL